MASAGTFPDSLLADLPAVSTHAPSKSQSFEETGTGRRSITDQRGYFAIFTTSVVTSPVLPQIDKYCLPTKLYGVISQKTIIVTNNAVRIPNCTTSANFLCMKPIKLWTI